MKIGFIGVGIMGKAMINNLLKKGFEVSFYARTPSKALDLEKLGAKMASSIKECVEKKDVVITIVGYPKDVEEVYYKDGIFDHASKGTYLVDMTTSSPSLALRLYKDGKERGFHVVDAPVTGGETGAKNGTLSILVGGDKEDFHRLKEVFEALGTNINYQGQEGSGQHAKLANQIMIAGTMSGLCEAISYATKEGLDLDTFIKSVATGAAGSAQLDTFAPKIIEGDYTASFYLKHFVKDMSLAKEESEKIGLNLEILKKALENYTSLMDRGFGDKGTQSLIEHYK